MHADAVEPTAYRVGHGEMSRLRSIVPRLPVLGSSAATQGASSNTILPKALPSRSMIRFSRRTSSRAFRYPSIELGGWSCLETCGLANSERTKAASSGVAFLMLKRSLLIDGKRDHHDDAPGRDSRS